MTVVPTLFHAATGTVDLMCDNCGNASTATTLATLAHIVVLTCAVCHSVSSHPLSGGGAPAPVQDLFTRYVARSGCTCGQVPSGRPLPIAQAHVKLQAERADGVGRWQAGTVR